MVEFQIAVRIDEDVVDIRGVEDVKVLEKGVVNILLERRGASYKSKREDSELIYSIL